MKLLRSFRRFLGSGKQARPPCAKCWWASRVLWVNALVAGLVALEAVTGALQPVLPVNFYVLVAVGLPVINAILRVLTSQPVALTAAAVPAESSEPRP